MMCLYVFHQNTHIFSTRDQRGVYKLNENEVLKVTYQCYRFCGSTVNKRHIEFLVAAM